MNRRHGAWGLGLGVKQLFIIFANIFASLAQLVEQLIRNEQVVGSSPIGGSKDCGWKISDFGLWMEDGGLRIADCGFRN